MSLQAIRKSVVPAIAAVALLGACASAEPPDTPPSDIASYPALAEDGYASVTVTRDFDVPRDWLRTWLAETSAFTTNFESTDDIAKPASTEVLSGEWFEPGSVRRVRLEDGHYVLERIVENSPSRLEYQIWAFTNAAGKNVDHIRGVQEFEALDADTTRFTWTYAALPNSGFKRPFVKRFVDSEVRDYLQSSLDRTVVQAETAYHEASGGPS